MGLWRTRVVQHDFRLLMLVIMTYASGQKLLDLIVTMRAMILIMSCIYNDHLEVILPLCSGNKNESPVSNLGNYILIFLSRFASKASARLCEYSTPFSASSWV